MSWIDVSRAAGKAREPNLAIVYKQGKSNWSLCIPERWLTEGEGYSIYVNTETRQVKIVQGGPQRPACRNKLFLFGFTTGARHLGVTKSGTRGEIQAVGTDGIVITFDSFGPSSTE